MTCKTFILNDNEVTTVYSVYLRIDTASKDLRTIIGGTDFTETQVDNIVACLTRLDIALAELHPLVRQLIGLQEG
jgi:hypothetical protein